MATVTAVIHTKNSEKTLDACLRSVAWCDAIFVVDMESTDSTTTIATRYGAKVYAVKVPASSGEGMIVEQVRQQFLEKVKTDWTLIVDSDEEVPVTLVAKLRELMMSSGTVAYNLARRNIIFGKKMEYTGYWPDYILRFFRTGQLIHPTEIHVQPIANGKVESLPASDEFALIHHHYQSISEFMDRLNKYTTFEAEKMAKTKSDASPLDALQAFFAQFHTRFFAQQGYKDGSTGFTISLLLAVYSLVATLKVWEKTKNETSINLGNVEATVTDACEATSYWVANEELNSPKNPVQKIGLKIRRKLHS